MSLPIDHYVEIAKYFPEDFDKVCSIALDKDPKIQQLRDNHGLLAAILFNQYPHLCGDQVCTSTQDAQQTNAQLTNNDREIQNIFQKLLHATPQNAPNTLFSRAEEECIKNLKKATLSNTVRK